MRRARPNPDGITAPGAGALNRLKRAAAIAGLTLLTLTAPGQSASDLTPRLILCDQLWNQTETNTTTVAFCLTNLLTAFKSSGWYDIWRSYKTPDVFFDYTW